MSNMQFKKVYDSSFKADTFKSFENEPIASASIGQVHVGYLHDGTKVAIKLRRYEVKQRVLADIAIIKFLNTLFKPLYSHHTKNSIEAVLSEFSSMIKEEISFQNELNNLIKFSHVYEKSDVIFPKAYEHMCSDSAIVMSFEEGFRFDDKKSIFKHKIDFSECIKTLVNFYTEQMLIKGYFHADPHPGNLLINTKGELILLDFGMIKSVPNNTRVAIIELIKAANEQDYEAYISANKKLGTIAYEADTHQLAIFTQKMFDIFSNDNLDSESMQKLAFEVLESTKDLPFKLPSDAIYILRVSAIIEGLGTTYIENFNGVKDILPILQENIPKALGSKDSISETLIEHFTDIPFMLQELRSTIKQASHGELKVELSQNQLEFIKQDLFAQIKSSTTTIAGILAGLFVLLYDKEYKEIALIIVLMSVAKLLYK
jgi:ubiquinone biosynthesis protein